MDALITGLVGLLGERNVLVEPDDVAPFCTDWRGRYSGTAVCVILPGSTEEVAAAVSACTSAGVAIVPQGGNTGLCGGATPLGGEVVVCLRRMNRIRAVDADTGAIGGSGAEGGYWQHGRPTGRPLVAMLAALCGLTPTVA